MAERIQCDVDGCSRWVKNITKHKKVVHSDLKKCDQCDSFVKDVTKHKQQKHRGRVLCGCGKFVKDLKKHQKEHDKGSTVCCGKLIKNLAAHLETDFHKRTAEMESTITVLREPCARVNQNDGPTPEESPDACTSEDRILTPPPWKRIIWIAFPDNPHPWNVKNSKSLAIEISDDHRNLPGMEWLNDNDLECLDRGLGQFYSRGRKDITLHQGLATMLIARPLCSVPIELHPWRWLEKQLNDPRTLHSSVIILHCTTSKPENLFDVCRRIESFSKQFSIRCVPTERELRQDQEKLDWMILDEIAKKSAKFNFRPKTCPGKGFCLLSDERFTFMKRDHSSGGLHTTLQVNPDRGFLQCDIPGKGVEKTNDPDGCHWIHQQFIRSLRARETLVCTVMDGDSEGNISCKIVSKTVTTRDEHGNIISRGPIASDEGNVDTFIQDTTDALKAHPQFMELFESVQVAGRLDIGFSSGEPWVNEISRWFNAHFFSLASLPEPYTQMVEALAISLLRYLGLLKHI